MPYHTDSIIFALGGSPHLTNLLGPFFGYWTSQSLTYCESFCSKNASKKAWKISLNIFLEKSEFTKPIKTQWKLQMCENTSNQICIYKYFGKIEFRHMFCNPVFQKTTRIWGGGVVCIVVILKEKDNLKSRSKKT